MGNGVSRKGAVIVKCGFRCAFGDVAMHRETMIARVERRQVWKPNRARVIKRTERRPAVLDVYLQLVTLTVIVDELVD